MGAEGSKPIERKVSKLDIGAPTDFKHNAHIGAQNLGDATFKADGELQPSGQESNNIPQIKTVPIQPTGPQGNAAGSNSRRPSRPARPPPKPVRAPPRRATEAPRARPAKPSRPDRPAPPPPNRRSTAPAAKRPSRPSKGAPDPPAHAHDLTLGSAGNRQSALVDLSLFEPASKDDTNNNEGYLDLGEEDDEIIDGFGPEAEEGEGYINVVDEEVIPTSSVSPVELSHVEHEIDQFVEGVVDTFLLELAEESICSIKHDAQVVEEEDLLSSLAELSRTTLESENSEEAKCKVDGELEFQQKAEEEAKTSKRKAEEVAAAKRKAREEAEESKRKAEEEAEEAKRKADEEAEEAKRKAEEVEAEAKRKAEEEEESKEAKRNAEEKTEAKRKAEVEAEAKRKAEEEAEAKRKAEEEAEAKRKAEDVEAEAKRKAEEEAEEAKHNAEEEAEAKRKAEEEAEEAKHKAEEEEESKEAKRKTDEEAEKAKCMADKVAEEAKPKAGDEAEKAKCMADKVAEEAKPTAGDEAEKAKCMADKVAEEAEPKAGEEAEKAKCMADKVAEEAKPKAGEETTSIDIASEDFQEAPGSEKSVDINVDCVKTSAKIQEFDSPGKEVDRPVDSFADDWHTQRAASMSSTESSPNKSPRRPSAVMNRFKGSFLDQSMNNDKEDEDPDALEELDPRAVAAAQWTDKEIRKLIDEIMSRGYLNDDGIHEITFGQLFKETGNVFDALSGICKTAKKYKIVTYDAEQLWQGKNDETKIVLLKTTHEGVVMKRRRKSELVKTKKVFGESLASQNKKCYVCSKTVYQMEFVGASGHALHKNCFRCVTCNGRLKPADYCVSYDGAFRCTAHHREFELAKM